jgi:hypothetical protein
MTGPAWLSAVITALMLLIAACCAARLVIWRLRGRRAEPEADALHVLMGMAMAGMLEPRLGLAPAAFWLVTFGSAGAWFGWRATGGRQGRSARWGCAHPAPHVAECAAMCYMLWAAGRGGHGQAIAMAMPGMGGSAAVANPALALVLAFFMLGYVLWTTDQLAAASSTRRAEAGAAAGVLAPRLAACYKIAMGAAMGYMLVAML